MLEEQGYEKWAWLEWLKKLLFLVVALILIFLLVKTFYLNRPKITPEEVAISYLRLEQFSQRNLAEEELFPDFEKVEILKEKYQNLRQFNWLQAEKAGTEPVFETKEIKIEGKEAKVKIFEKTNRKEEWIFFAYYLPKEIIFEASLTKTGSWKRGYQWKIMRIDSPDLILQGRIGEKIAIRENVFIKPIKIEKVEFPDVRKLYSLEIEYENNSNEPIFIYPFSDWRIIDLSGETFGPPSVTSALFLREPTLLGGELKPAEIKRGYVMFETEKEISAKEVVFKNMEKRVIFEID